VGRLIGTGTQYSFLNSALNHSYGYDAASNRTSFTAPGGASTSYSYDTLNRLTSLTDTNTGQFGFGYDALGRRTSLTRPNSVGTSYSYDTLSHLLGEKRGKSGQAYFPFSKENERLICPRINRKYPADCPRVFAGFRHRGVPARP